jgi:hypothetical protein
LVLGRRLVILVAVLMGLTAFAASVAPTPENPRRGARGTPTPSPSPAPATSVGDPAAVSVTMESAQQPQQVEATVGDDVALEVEADAVDSVVIDGLDAVQAVAPDSPARFDLFADRIGTYPIRLLDSGRQLGELVIRPNR